MPLNYLHLPEPVGHIWHHVQVAQSALVHACRNYWRWAALLAAPLRPLSKNHRAVANACMAAAGKTDLGRLTCLRGSDVAMWRRFPIEHEQTANCCALVIQAIPQRLRSHPLHVPCKMGEVDLRINALFRSKSVLAKGA